MNADSGLDDMPSRATHDVTVERDVPWEMRDGTRLYADIYRPVGSDEFPVVLARTPYNKAHGVMATHAHPKWFARHGYIVVVQDVRGRWASEGEWYPFAHEEEDGFDSVEHAAQLPGSTGRVGMYGTSYVAATQLLAAVAGPPHLECITPGATSSDCYDGWAYRGGALNQVFVQTWAMLLAQDVARRRHDGELENRLVTASEDTARWIGSLPLQEVPLLKEHEIAPWYFDWLEHPARDAYWTRWSIEERYDHVRVPALHIGGWYDIFLDGTIRNYVGMREHGATELARANQHLVVGPWPHLPWGRFVSGRDFGPEATNSISKLQLSWWDRWLKDPPFSGEDAPVRIFVMGRNSWRSEHTWPPPWAKPVAYFLHSGGRAASLNGDGELSADAPGDEPPDDFVYDPRNPVRSNGGRSCCRPPLAPMGPADQRAVETTNSVLVYTGPRLKEPLEVTGNVRVVLYAGTTARDTDWTAKLVDVHPDGTAINIADGIIRARYRESLSTPTPIEPDRVYEYTLDLGSTSNLFDVGHRVRLEIASSNFPCFDRNLNTGGPLGKGGIGAAILATQTVYHDRERASRLFLPIVSA